jgi:xanthine dehydrogenase accessory factor
MREILNALDEALNRKTDTVLAVIVESRGSSPRKAGAAMLCGAAGRLTGTIGGGIAEHLAAEEAKRLIREKRSAIKEYALHPNGAEDIGGQCGGEVRVFLGYIPGDDAASAAVCAAARRAFDTGNGRLVLEAREAAGKMNFRVDADAELRLSPEGGPFFTLPLHGDGFVYIAGGGHIARELCPLLTHLDFRVVVIDDREDFADAARFPGALRCIRADFNALGEVISVTRHDYIVAVTSGHTGDYLCAAFALTTEARYIGMIGSAKKIAFVREKLRTAGFSRAGIHAPRFHAPIGIAISSETPAEVAVSIAAELIAVRAEGRVRSHL